MSRRPGTRMPILSMLDLLFGSFGAMIVIATLLTFLRQQESRIAQAPFFHVAVEIERVSESAALDVAALFFRFELTPAGGDQVLEWSPLSHESRADSAAESVTYLGRTAEDESAAMLLLPEEVVDEYRDAELAIRIENIPQLPTAFDDERLRISIVIMTAGNACAGEDIYTVGALRQFNRAADNAESPPLSLFGIMASGANGSMCVRADGTPDGAWGVNDGGRIRILPL